MKTTKRAKQRARQIYHSCLSDGLLNEDKALAAVEEVLSACRRESYQVLRRFSKLVQMEMLSHTASILTARPLDENARSSIKAKLVSRYGSHLTTYFAEDTSLIGGMRIQIGSDVYDGTIKSKLINLEDDCKRGGYA